MQLDFLEYYGGRQTEIIHLKVHDGEIEKIAVKLTYRTV